MSIEIVIASYSEALDWVGEIPKTYKRTIYRATEGLTEERPDKLGKLPIIRIPNGGREAGQYLWHIIHRRTQLSDITLFVQGDFLRHGKISSLSINPQDPRPMAYLGVIQANDKPWPFELGVMHKELHDYPWDGKPSRSGAFSVGAQIWVRKKLIRSVPSRVFKKYYEKRNDPHFAHLLEGTWHTVFGVYR